MLVGVIGLRALAPIVFCSSAERPRALAGGSKFPGDTNPHHGKARYAQAEGLQNLQ